MECGEARAEVSAAIDEGIEVTSQVASHVDGCGSCRVWRDRAHQLRRATLRPVPAADTGSVQVETLPARFNLNRWMRIALGWGGLVLVVANSVGVFAAGSGSAVHLQRHQDAFSVALGLAFVFVAWRPDRAYGMVPFAATFTFALSVAAIIDLFNGASTLWRESGHLIELAGLGLLWALGHIAGPGRSGPSLWLQRVRD